MTGRLYILFGFLLVTFTHQKLNATNYNTAIYGTIQKENCKIVYLYGYQKLSDILEGKVVLDSSIVSTAGTYRFEFNITRPTEFQIKDNNGYITYGLYISPGDSLKYNYKIAGKIKTTTIDGKGHTFNAYRMDFVDKFYLDSIIREKYSSSFKKLNTEEFTKLIDERKEDQLKFCIKYRKNSEGFSDEINNIAVNEIMFKWAVDKLQYLWKYNYMNKIKGNVDVDSTYFNFLSQIELNNPNLVWLPRYHKFLDAKSNMDFDNYRNTEDNITAIQYKCQNLIKANLISDTLKGINKSLSYALLIQKELKRSNKYTPLTLDSLWSLYKPLVVDSSLATYLQNKIALFKHTLYNAEPIDFSLLDENGDTVSLSDFRGKLVYLDFWETTCAPCLKEIPESNKLQKKLKDENVVFLNVSFDRSQEKWSKLIEDKNWGGVHLITNKTSDDQFLKSKFNFNGFPHYAIINKNGVPVNINANRPSHNAYTQLTDALEKSTTKNDSKNEK